MWLEAGKMVFVNQDKRQPKVERNYKYGAQHKCVNCGSEIDNPYGSIDARRFCSTKCREEYFGQ